MKNTCRKCQMSFLVYEQDQIMLEEFKAPEPTLCPACRRQRRHAYRNERNLHHRNCDQCNQSIISVYPSEVAFPVYCKECWWSDEMDGLNYGQDVDFNRPFFEQFHELAQKVPHLALHQEGSSENCQYVNYGFGNKSCYLMLGVHCEDVYYSNPALQCKNCVDCTRVVGCELCYECIDCTNCYQLFYSQDCINCSESMFLKDCIGSKNCFASAGLRNAEFVFANEQLTEREYRAEIAEIQLTPERVQQCLQQRDKLDQGIPKKPLHGLGCENVSGDYLDFCKDVHQSFDCLHGIEEARYCDTCAMSCRKLMDCSYVGDAGELCYEVNGAAQPHNLVAVYYARALKDSQYSQYCMFSQHLFGCYGLKRKQFCIFNKPYSEEEYHQLKAQIIEHMSQTGEYGEFFPMLHSAFPYNESVAMEYFPLSKESVEMQGLQWRDPEPSLSSGGALMCQKSGRPFRLIAQEKAFYQRFGLPDPTEHPDERHLRRLQARNPRQLWQRSCPECDTSLQSTYDPKRGQKVLCEGCYMKSQAEGMAR